MISDHRERKGPVVLRLSALPTVLESRFGATGSGVADAKTKNASVALILRPEDSGDTDPSARASQVLVIKRAHSERDPWSGHMALPGGRVEEADHDLVHTAVRETLEETALDLGAGGETLGRVDTVRPVGTGLPAMTIWPFVFRVAAGTEAAPNSHEVAAVHWFRVADLMDERNQGVYRFSHRGRDRDFPCIRVRGQVIWGLTYRIMNRFFELVS